MSCAVCSGRGYTGRGPTKDACPECAFEAEMEWRQYLKYEAMKARAEVTPAILAICDIRRSKRPANRVRRAA